MWPALNAGLQVLLVLMKGGVAVMLLNLIVKLEKVLVAVTLCDGLVVPTLTLPKARLVGLTTSAPDGSCAWANLAAERPITKRRVKLKTVNAKRDDFVRDMAFLPRNTDHGSTSVVMYAPSLPAPQEFERLDREH
jgi:hypothetical protein